MPTRIARAVAVGALAALLAAFTAVPAAAADPVVLFDEGHGQRFLVGQEGDLQLSGLGEIMRGERLQVRSTTRRLDAAALAGVGAVVISGPFVPLGADEVEALRAFVSGGGRLAVMLHIGQPLLPLLSRLGIQVFRSPVRESDGRIGGKSSDFAVTRFERHPLTEGIARVAVFGCWALQTTNAKVTALARTGPRAWLDTNGDGSPTLGEPVGTAPVILAGGEGSGQFAVFGDDAIFQNRFLKEHNGELGRRLARWLAGGVPSSAPRRGVIDL